MNSTPREYDLVVGSGDDKIEDDLFRPIRQLEDDPDKIIIGLDTSRVPVRAIVTEIITDEGRECICPWGCATFDDLGDFCYYWDHNWNFPGTRVALPNDQADPLGVKAWLESQGYPLERYPWMIHRAHLASDLTLLNMAIGSEFEPAYALALHAFYRRNAAEVINGIWTKLYEAEFVLRDLRREAHRLAAALSPAGRDSIPF